MATINGTEYFFSNYVIFEPIPNNKYILIHSYLNNIDIIDECVADKLKKIKRNDGEIDLESDLLDKLIKKGYVVKDPQEDKNRFLMIATKLSSKKNETLSYMLIPSYSCNFSCPYCFEGSLTRKERAIMKEDLVDDIFEIIDKDILNKKTVSLSLFGGEPLLKENLDINKYIFKKAKKRKLKISVITNGYDLDYYIAYIKNNVFSDFQITLDGDHKHHNKTKFTKDDNDTFSKILNNIEMVLNTSTTANISVRINTNNDNLGSLKELYNNFLSRGFLKDKRFSFYTKSVEECAGRKDKEISDVDIVKNISFFDNKLQNMKTNSQYSTIIKEMESIFDLNRKFGNFKTRYCGATENNRLIDPYGDVYSCLEEVGKKERRIGFVDTQNKVLKTNDLMKEWENRRSENLEPCFNCKFSLICAGGCGMAAYRHSGSLKKPWCGKIKDIAKDVIYEIARELT